MCFPNGLLVAAKSTELDRVKSVRMCVTGIQRNRFLIVRLRRFPIPHVHFESSEDHAALRQRGIQLDGLLSRTADFGPTLLRPKDLGGHQERVGGGDSGRSGGSIALR